MKKIFLVCVPLIFSGATFQSEGYVINEEVILLEPKPIEPLEVEIPTPDIQDLVQALIQVESRGNDSAIGDTHLDEPSVGVLQIRPIMVREVNRICKRIGSHQRFTLKDRFDRDKSIHMFLIWKEFHHKDSDFEAISRSWNGGPRWRKINRTKQYWAKVEQQLNNN